MSNMIREQFEKAVGEKAFIDADTGIHLETQPNLNYVNWLESQLSWTLTENEIPDPLEQVLFVVDGKVKFGVCTISEFIDSSGWGFPKEKVLCWRYKPEPPTK